MRKYWLGVMIGAAVLASGCGGEAAPEETPAVSESAVEVSIEVTEPETEAEESLKEAWESLEAAEESLKAQEESLTVEETFPSQEETQLRLYKQLTENPKAYQNQVIAFSGNVIRAASDGAASRQIVLAVEGQEQAKLVCDYKESLIDVTLMVGDQVTVTGVFQDLNRYRMDSGKIETLPAIRVSSFDTVTLAVRETKAEAETGSPEVRESSMASEETTGAFASEETSAEDLEIEEDNQGSSSAGVVGPGIPSDMTGPGVERQYQPGEIGPGAGSESPLGGSGM